MTKEGLQPPYSENNLNKLAKEVLKPVWKRLFNTGGWGGRPWGKKGKGINGPFRGSHFALGTREGTAIILNVSEDGKILLHEFTLTKGTALGDEIKSLLKEKGITISEEQQE